MNQTEMDADIPVLTDIIDDDELAVTAAKLSLQQRQQLEATLSDKLTSQLSQHMPPLLESAVQSALRKHFPAAIDTRLQSAILAALATALPAAVRCATDDLATHVTSEMRTLLQPMLEAEVRRSVAEEVARLKI